MWVVVCAFACDPLLTHTHGSRQLQFFLSSPVICDVIFSVWGKKNKHTHPSVVCSRESSSTNSARERAETSPLEKGSINNTTHGQVWGKSDKGAAGLLLEMFPTHKREKEEEGRRIILYCWRILYWKEREGVKKREPYSLNCQQYPKWMLQYNILYGWSCHFLLYRFFGVKECCPVSGECVCVHNHYLVRKCNWDFEDIYSVYVWKESLNVNGQLEGQR